MSVKLYGNTSKRERKKIVKNEDVLNTAEETVKPKKKVLKIVLISVAALVVVIAATWIILHKTVIKAPEIKNDGNQISVSSSTRKSNYFTFLLCGTDVGDQRTDTIMVASFDIDNKKINIVSVPRDTMLNVTWSVKKINSAYALDGIEGLKSALKSILGFSVDYYAVVDLKAFKEIVDAIGGVKFNVPEDMYYEDPDQDLLINLKEGEQTLNGEKAMELIRYRSYARADLQRIEVQQQFIKAIFAQTIKIGNIAKVNELSMIFSKYMKTDLSTGNLIWLGEKMLALKSDDIMTMTMPGTTGTYNGGSYVLLDAKKVVETVNQYLNPGKKDIVLNDLDIVTLSEGYIVSSTGKKVKDTSGGGRSGSNEEASSSAPESTPAPTPGATSSPSVSPKPSGSPPPSVSPTQSASPKPSASPTASPSPSTKPNPTPSATPKPPATPTPSIKP